MPFPIEGVVVRRVPKHRRLLENFGSCALSQSQKCAIRTRGSRGGGLGLHTKLVVLGFSLPSSVLVLPAGRTKDTLISSLPTGLTQTIQSGSKKATFP